MNLMQFLTVGKSFVGFGGTPARYRLMAGALPKFGDEPLTAFAEAGRHHSHPPAPRSREKGSGAKACPLPAAVEDRQTSEAFGGVDAVERGSGPLEERPAAPDLGMVSNVTDDVAVVAEDRETGSTASRRNPRLGARRLEEVRVVRNELTSDDLDFVPKPSSPFSKVARFASAAGSFSGKAAKKEAGSPRWSELTARLFTVHWPR